MKTRHLCAWTLALLATAGCGGDDPVTPEQLMGEYSLVMVNGVDLPATTWTSDGMSEEATGGQLVLESAPTAAPTDMLGGLYSLSLSLRTNVGGGPVDTNLFDGGLWTLDGDQLSFETGSPTLVLCGRVVDGVLILEMSRAGVPDPPPSLMFAR